MRMQFGIISGCFKDCVMNFRDDKLSDKEKSCLGSCAMREIQSMQQMAATQSTIMSRGGAGSGP